MFNIPNEYLKLKSIFGNWLRLIHFIWGEKKQVPKYLFFKLPFRTYSLKFIFSNDHRL